MGVILLCNRGLRTAKEILLCYRGVHAVNGRVMLYFALETVYFNTRAVLGVLLNCAVIFSPVTESNLNTGNIASHIKFINFYEVHVGRGNE